MIQDSDYGAETIRERLCNKKVLLVLDDVDSVKQLEYLAATREWFGPGSRIIITTRDEHVLSNANAKYKLSLLRMDQALELFSRHAFQKNSPPQGYEEISNRAIQYTGRLPLALKVIGSFFHGRQLRLWESALNRLAKTTDRDIFEILKISFDGLNESEKKMLLDIACFFKGNDEERVTRILDSFGFDPMIGICVLIEKSLITILDKRLHMHDLIQEMSWQIVRESYPNSRMWKLEDVNDFGKKNKKLKAIEAIVMPCMIKEKSCISDDVFESMKNLRLLQIHEEFTSSEPTFLPDELRWLRWDKYPFYSLPLANSRKLVGLEMFYGKMEELWKGRKVMLHLKSIQLYYLQCLEKFPDLSGAPNIETLDLSSCTSLVEVHESLGSLKRLVYLNMRHCEKLKCLPSRLEMESLETLNLSYCFSLERFPEISPCMVKLSHIDLRSCLGIKELPSSIRYLSSLSFLNLRLCESLENIPNTICELQNLKSLNLSYCIKLDKLPQEFGSMFSMKVLDLSYTQLEAHNFPKDFKSLTSLEELNLSGNLELIELPATISHLSRLKQLQLNNCYQLQSLHGLPSKIQVLMAYNYTSLEKIEDLSQKYEWLHKIWLVGCETLVHNQENGRYLDKMLQKSFLEKCASVDHGLSIGISTSKIPRWFVDQQHGRKIRLNLPPNWHSRIKGVAVCALFSGEFDIRYIPPRITFTFKNDRINASPPTISELMPLTCFHHKDCTKGDFVWLLYIPMSYFQRINENWSHINQPANLVIQLESVEQVVRCGAHIVYKEDVETCVSVHDDYGNMDHCLTQEDDYTFVYLEKN